MPCKGTVWRDITYNSALLKVIGRSSLFGILGRLTNKETSILNNSVSALALMYQVVYLIALSEMYEIYSKVIYLATT